MSHTIEEVEAMSATQPYDAGAPLVLHFGALLKQLTEQEFYEFCQHNSELRLELTSEGDLIAMPPTGGKTGHRNSKLTARLTLWAEADATGLVFGSSPVFALPNGAKRSPDAAWVKRERWAALSEEEQERFPPLCPDFVIELRSRTDALKTLQAKLEEYVASGAQLGWLLDPQARKVYVYRPGTATEVLDDPETIDGEPLLGGFALAVREIWE